LISNGVTLKEIAEKLNAEFRGNANAKALDVTHDSRQAGTGSLFVAVRGLTMDGHRFIEDVMRRGAIGVVSELEAPENFQGAWLKVSNARKALAQAAAVINGNASRQLKLVGITGTNGKTTTCYLVSSIFEANQQMSAVMGTVESRIGAQRFSSERTTGEASETQKFLRWAVDEGCHFAAMECSSHAIDLHRCDALRFAVAVFTNLTPDHLDYHRTMEEYFGAKRRLFDGSLGEKPGVSVINVDDERGATLANDLRRAGAQVLTYAIDKEADLTASNVDISFTGMRFRLRSPAGEREMNSPLVGRPHVYNLLAAAGCGLALNFSPAQIAAGLETCAGAPGRFERVAHRGPFVVVVDYAHTNDALDNVLRTARGVAAGRVITVFGCGGDRDRTKRAPMGETAARLSDVVILTSDNPRTEDPEAILADVEIGLRKVTSHYLKIADRREAIYRAVNEARDGDVVIIAGKGHEDYQIIGTQKIHFDDREVARDALRERGLI
jgi:UDP-N-acetylmuramyl-tripeptide synthetase